MSQTKIIYSARPIDQVGVGASNWSTMTNLGSLDATPNNWVVYQPWQAFRVGSEARVDPRLRAINDQAVTLADAMFAVLPLGVSTYGTIAEIELAWRADKPVALITDQRPSWSLPAEVEVFNLGLAGVLAAIEWLTDALADKVVSGNTNGMQMHTDFGTLPSGRTP
jgi:hypothetical protein